MQGTCSVCKQYKTVCKNRKFGKEICQNCYRRSRYQDPSIHECCSVCGKIKPVRARNKSGKAICYACDRKDPTRHKKCSKCKKVKHVHTRTESGKALCQSCHQRTKVGQCRECQKTKVIQAFRLCYACYQRQRRASLTTRLA